MGKCFRLYKTYIRGVAVADAIMNGGQKDDFIDSMKKYGQVFETLRSLPRFCFHCCNR